MNIQPIKSYNFKNDLNVNGFEKKYFFGKNADIINFNKDKDPISEMAGRNDIKVLHEVRHNSGDPCAEKYEKYRKLMIEQDTYFHLHKRRCTTEELLNGKSDEGYVIDYRGNVI